MLFFIAACFLPACIVSLVSTAVIRRVAPQLGLVDQPAARKVHVVPTPLGGGIGIWLGVMLPLLCASGLVLWIQQFEVAPSWFPTALQEHVDGARHRTGQLWGLLTAGTILALMGLMDDLWDLPWKPGLLSSFVWRLLPSRAVRRRHCSFPSHGWGLYSLFFGFWS